MNRNKSQVTKMEKEKNSCNPHPETTPVYRLDKTLSDYGNQDHDSVIRGTDEKKKTHEVHHCCYLQVQTTPFPV